MINSYVSIDLETTGCNPKIDKIIEIGAVKVKDGIITDSFQEFINPGRKLREEIIELTGISNESLKGARELKDVLKEFLNFIGDHVLVGHQIIFDYAFLKKACVNEKISFERKGIDTLRIARIHLLNLESKKLADLCKYYHIEIKAHRALEDARATSILLENLVKDFEKAENMKEFIPKELHYQVKKDSPITKAQKERLEKLIELHQLEIDYEIDKLTKSEASRYTDRILATFGR